MGEAGQGTNPQTMAARTNIEDVQRRDGVSLIIPVKNDADRLRRCLNRIRKQTLQPNQIIVVDGHSSDNTAQVARDLGAIVLFEEFGTRAAACQVGVDASTNPIVAFTDADCLPDSMWLERLRDSLTDGLAGVGGRVVNEGETYWEKGVNLALDTLVGSANSIQGRNYLERRYVQSISGCNSMYRRSDLEAVGGFNIHLPTAEDTEINRRLLRRGRLVYVPDAVVHHLHKRGLRAFPKRMMQYGVGRGLTLIPGLQLIIPFCLIIWIVIAILSPWIGLLLLLIYFVILACSTVDAALRSGDFLIAAGLPLIYVLEHGSYAIGFWKGIVHRGLARQVSRGAPDPHGDEK